MKSFKRNVLILIAILICISGFVLIKMLFEGSAPSIDIVSDIEFLTKPSSFTIKVSDIGRGLRKIEVVLNQEGRKHKIFHKVFNSKGFLNLDGEHEFQKILLIDPKKHNLAQGRVELRVAVWDYSKRRGGDGNISVKSIDLIVDTIPPSIAPLTRLNYVNRGGSGLLLYRVSSDTELSGVYVDELFFKGYKAKDSEKNNIRLCYFAVPVFSKDEPSVYIWARDIAGNTATSTFNYRIKRRRFNKKKINLSERFVQNMIQYFSSQGLPDKGSEIDKYLFINRDIREKSHKELVKLCSQSVPDKLWDGPFLRLKNSATMAGFGDHRYYYYKGKKIDEQIHLGIDLASLSHSPVPAGNSGKVIYAEPLGIYGNTVVIDHGQGILSLYGHLSSIDVEIGKMVQRGDIIGHTGQSGLAGGDHLHFAIMVNGVFVNPIEWWDPHWIKDNIERKLAFLNGEV